MNSIKDSLVSIVITNYNYAQYLREAIESALNQTYKNTEIILIDDGSTDDSRKVYNEFSKKIRIIEHKQNHGIVYTRNEALREIKGDFLCFIDADNILPKDYLAKLFTKTTAEKADVVYTDMQLFGDRNDTVQMPEFSLNGIIAKNIVDMGALIRVKAIGEQKFDENLDKLSHEDWDFFLGLALAGRKFVKVHGVKLNYRIHNDHRNQMCNFRENVLRLLKVNSYIIEKYKRTYSDEVDFLPENQIIQEMGEQHEEIASLRTESQKIAELMEQIAKKDAEIRERDEILKRISESRSYRIVNAFAKILRKKKGKK